MMTFYLGKEYKLYEKKYETVYDHYKYDIKNPNLSSVFGHIIDILYKEITRVNNKNGKKEGK